MPQILENWHQPYYRELLQTSGMAKAMDLYKWEIMCADRDKVLPSSSTRESPPRCTATYGTRAVGEASHVPRPAGSSRSTSR